MGVRSMTGFGQAAVETGRLRFVVELRGVNHRGVDLRLRIPPELQAWESEVRRRVTERVRRGRVEVSVLAQYAEGAEPRPTLNRALLEEVRNAAERARADLGLPGELDLATVLGIPGMFRLEATALVPGEPDKRALLEALDAAFALFDADRAREGQVLARDLAERAAVIRSRLRELRSRAGFVPGLLRARLLERIRSLGPGLPLDPGRIEQEAALLAERADVSEELVRLEGHLDALGALLDAPGESLGKRLDFLLQEIQRETNTVCAKSGDLELSQHALAIRVETERMREQAQNVE